MITTETFTIRLKEHKPTQLPRNLLSEDSGEELWRGYRKHLSIEFPSPKNEYNWELTPSGWAGFITIPGYLFELQPKVEIGNLFRMLEYAYRLQSFHFSEGEVETDSLEGFFERLANLLARRILDRVNRGLYRSYVPKSKNLSFLRGRLDVRRSMRIPWDTKLHCYYTQHTTNNEDNQILAWTLQRITRNNIMAEKPLRLIHSVCRALQGIEIKSFHPRDCSRRIYNRLNEDYRQLHALCRFFLENTGPSHDLGARKMLPFLVNMDRLFEMFVAEWLQVHLPSGWSVKPQERICFGDDNSQYFDIDLVLYHENCSEPVCVIDTKYKGQKPQPDDIAQVVAYAVSKNCKHAVLVYPVEVAPALDVVVGSIHVRSLAYTLDGTLEEQGHYFLENLLSFFK